VQGLAYLAPATRTSVATQGKERRVFRKQKAVVGLDIGSSAIKAVQLKPNGKQYRIAAFASEPVPADAIVDGAIIDADAVVATIKRLFDASKAFKTKDVCAS